MRTRTGFIEWEGHQLGGSILTTLGAWPFAVEVHTSANTQAYRATRALVDVLIIPITPESRTLV